MQTSFYSLAGAALPLLTTMCLGVGCSGHKVTAPQQGDLPIIDIAAPGAALKIYLPTFELEGPPEPNANESNN